MKISKSGTHFILDLTKMENRRRWNNQNRNRILAEFIIFPAAKSFFIPCSA